MIAGRETIE